MVSFFPVSVLWEAGLTDSLRRPVIRGVRYFLAHTPGLVSHGSRPARDIARDPGLVQDIASHLRSYEAAAAYPPNRTFLGGLSPEELRHWERPWYSSSGPATRWHPYGEIMPEEEFCGLLKISDQFDLVRLEGGFAEASAAALKEHPHIGRPDLELLGQGGSLSEIEDQCADGKGSVPLYVKDGRLVGCVRPAHEEDASLAADVLLENLACKATAAIALRTLLAQEGVDPDTVEYVLNSGEEAVGDRYQRGGGGMAKAVAEMAGCTMASGSDVKGFCCGPVQALAMAGSLVSSRVFRRVAVVAGCSLAKLGMKYRGHLDHDQPILEDVLAGVAVLVDEDDGASPVLRLDSLGRHTVGAGSSQQAILEKLVAEPLERMGLAFRQVDKYATELHNPELTGPSGSGDVPLLNYKMIGGLASLKGEFSRAEVPGFIEAHGMPGFSPTQGHIASAVPFLGHAVGRMRAGTMQRAMFLAKGSLFLGRMTQMSDGMSFILERNPG